MGEHPVILALELAPLTGIVYWIMSSEEVAKLTGAALSSQSGFKGFTDPRLSEGFYRYLFLEALNIADELSIYGDLSLQMHEPLPRN